MKYIFTLLFALVVFSTNGQDNSKVYVDSLIESYGDIDDSLLVKKLIRESFYKVIKSDEKGLWIARRTLEITKQNNDKEGETDALNNIGISFDIKGQSDSSAFYFNQYLSHSELMNDSIRIGRALNNLGMLSWNLGDYNKAITLFYRYLEISEKMDVKEGTANACSNIGLLYMELKQISKALEYSKKAFNMRLELEVPSRLATSCNNIGICYKELKQYDSALFYYNKGIGFAEAINNQNQLGDLYTNLGNLYVLQNDNLLAYKTLKKSLKYRPNESLNASTYVSLSEVATLLNKPNEALDYAKKAYELRKNDEGLGNLVNVYLNLANAYYNIKNYKDAQTFYLKWGEAKDSIYSKENTKAVADLEIRYQTEKKEKELANKELELSAKDLEISNRNNLLVGLAGGILIIILLSLYLIQRKKRKAQYEKDEAIIHEKDRGLKAIILAQEEERKRIAKELHDGIVQQLGGLKLGLQKEFANNATDKTKNLIKILDDSAQELRELSHKMMPKALSELGLVPALEDMLSNSLGNTNIRFKFEHFGIAERFADSIEITIYRIAQELINNVTKHSRASQVNIQLFKSGKYLVLIVEDNGKGFELESEKQGIGLLNISSRLDTVNGKVNFEPSPESGTLATVKIPID